MSLPYDYAEAKAAIEAASRNQKNGEQQLRDAWKDYGAKERAYRMALAKKMLEYKAGGMAISACGDLSRGDKHVADLKYYRDVAEGVREAAQQAAWRHSADRRELEQLIDWSKRVSLTGHEREPDELPEPIGARRAA